MTKTKTKTKTKLAEVRFYRASEKPYPRRDPA